jgi:hypothetical protein
MLILAPAVFLLNGEPSMGRRFSFTCLVLVLSIVVVVLCNTWAKKKKK